VATFSLGKHPGNVFIYVCVRKARGVVETRDITQKKNWNLCSVTHFTKSLIDKCMFGWVVRLSKSQIFWQKLHFIASPNHRGLPLLFNLTVNSNTH